MKITNKLSKKLFDFVLAFIGLIVLSPLLITITIAVWLQDFKSPFYISDRVGKDEKIFKIIKLRSMVIGADKKGIDSTSVNDTRITRVGKIVRKYKLDELSQLLATIHRHVYLQLQIQPLQKHTQTPHAHVEESLPSVVRSYSYL